MLPAITPHWQARRWFAGTDDWAKYLYDRVLRRMPRLPLPGRRLVAGVTLKGHRDPFHIRLGATDLLVLEEMFQAGEYAFVEENLPNVQRIVDLGANVGFSLRYWHKVFPTAKILAVEPDPDNCHLCIRNVEAARFSHQVTLVQACVGSYRRRVRLGGGEEWAYRMVEGVPASEALTDVLPLAELLETYSMGGSIDLLKCDIEGAEQELFKDCRDWISQGEAIVIELHPPYSPSDLQADLKAAGARFELVREFSAKVCPVLLLRRSTVLDPA